jgi:hypothetical protein
MKKSLLILSAISALLFISVNCTAQKDPVEYMKKIGDAHRNVTEEFLSYTSAVAHGKSARKVEKRRKDLMNAVTQARAQVKHMQPFEKTDTTLRAASYEYLNMTYSLLKEDYGKIVDMEEIAEQSYDNMEAYIMAQEKANEKMQESADRLEAADRVFAANHNINLIEEKDAISKKADKVEKVDKYYHQVFLIYFKSMKQEMYLIAALSKKDINGVEQNKNALLKSTEEGLALLPGIKAYENDQSLIQNCKKLLQFYQKEANEKIQGMVDFMMKTDGFEKAKKKFDTGSKSKEDADEFNKQVKEINNAGTVYNKTNNELNQSRSKLLGDWENAVKNFMDKHIPQSK